MNDESTAYQRNLLLNAPTLNTGYLSERQEMATANYMAIMAVCNWVRASRSLNWPVQGICEKNASRRRAVMKTGMMLKYTLTSLLNALSLGFRGFRSIKSGSPGSTPNAMAGKPSVTKLTQRICTAVKA